MVDSDGKDERKGQEKVDVMKRDAMNRLPSPSTTSRHRRFRDARHITGANNREFISRGLDPVRPVRHGRFDLFGLFTKKMSCPVRKLLTTTP